MMKRGKIAALAAALSLVLALNSGVLTAAAEENRDSKTQAVLKPTSKEFTILNPSEAPGVPAGLRTVTVVVDDQRTRGWIEDGDGQQEFVVLYGRTADGEPGFYRYDLLEKTIQRYTAPIPAVTTDQYLKLVLKYNQLQQDYEELDKENIMFKIMAVAAVLGAVI